MADTSGPILATSCLADWLASMLAKSDASLVLAAPYIQKSALEYVLQDVNPRVLRRTKVVTYWNKDSLLDGSLDIDIYEYCRSTGAELLSARRLHSKFFGVDDELVVVGSANITRRGLGLAADSNREVLVAYLASTADYRNAVKSILSTTTSVLEADYIEAAKFLRDAPVALKHDIANSTPTLDTQARLEQIPPYETPAHAWLSYKKQRGPWVIGSAELPIGLTKEAFFRSLRRAFMREALINRFCSRVYQGPLYFGEAKCVVRNIVGDPSIHLRALTQPTQRLYTWLCLLFPEAYAVDRPNYSERILQRADPLRGL